MLTKELLYPESKNQPPEIIPIPKNQIITMKVPETKLHFPLNARVNFLKGKLISSAKLLSPVKLELTFAPEFTSPRYRQPIRTMFQNLLKNKHFVSELSIGAETKAGICFQIKEPAKWSGPDQLYSYMLHYGQNESFLYFSTLLMQNQLFSKIELSCGVAFFELVPELNNDPTLKELKRAFVDKYKIDPLFATYFARPALIKGKLGLFLKREFEFATTVQILQKLKELCSFSQLQLGGLRDQVISLENESDAQASTEKFVPDEPMPKLIFSLMHQTVEEKIIEEQPDEWKKYLNLGP